MRNIRTKIAGALALALAGTALGLGGGTAQAADAWAAHSAYTYTGAWSQTSEEHYSNQAGAAATINFSAVAGATIQPNGAKTPTNGTVAIQLDGNAPVVVSEYAATSNTYSTLWTSPALTAGNHTLKITVQSGYGSVVGAYLTNGTFGGPGYVTTPPPVTDPPPATGPQLYVDPVNGNDANNGSTTATAWRTVAKVNNSVIPAGTQVNFLRGQTYTTSLIADNSGTSSSRVTYGAYGTGAPPTFDGGGIRYPAQITGAFVTVQDVQVQNAGQSDRVGLGVYGTDALVQRIKATANALGVEFYNGAHRGRLTASQLVDNKTVIQPSGNNDDYGATGAGVLQADNVRIDHNTISGNIGPSADYGTDGSAVEIYGAVGTTVDHNVSSENETFTELGQTRTSGTVYHNNLITSSVVNARGLNAQGSGTFGPVLNTTFVHNTIDFTGANAVPIDIGSGATVSLFNNIIKANYAGYTEGTISEGCNVLPAAGGNDINGGTLGANTVRANPLFVSATDRHLQATSPAVNRCATRAAAGSTDLGDNPRLVGTLADAGAYERQ